MLAMNTALPPRHTPLPILLPILFPNHHLHLPSPLYRRTRTVAIAGRLGNKDLTAALYYRVLWEHRGSVCPPRSPPVVAPP
ncbi:hypothetical protein E2C01_057869 [Portunus trituberculatus]|uniref:Uncharacterized protein n=1 Tax=Portunus trituberculatus TaxID=210409 RepID=A0A5B7H1N4_PORTR|nr:hypothetical protein [Portunus trituberculatus]